MLKEFIATGETVEIAFQNACNELGVETSKAQCEVIEQAVKKTFGLFGGSPAKVRAFYNFGPAEKASQYIMSLFDKMNISGVEIEIVEEQEGCVLKVSGDDISFIIGHRGDTLDSLQYLASLVANQGEEKYYRISLDVGNFREKRKETLDGLGRKMAAKAVRMGRNQVLEPMNPYERRIIHTAVQEVEGAKSWSEGVDINRHVVVGPVDGEKFKYNKNRNDRRPSPKGGYNNRTNNYNKGPRKEYNKTENKPARENYANKISETAPVPYSPAPLDTNTTRKKVEDAPLYGRIK